MPERSRAPERFELYGVHAVREALRARRRALSRLRVRKGLQRSELCEILAAARDAGVAIEEVSPEELAAAAAGAATQGVLLSAGPLPELTLAELAGPPSGRCTLVALDGVEDPQNLGAIARVAEAAGAAGLLLTRRRAAPLGAAASRANAGALEWLPVARVPNLARALNDLKQRGFWSFGCDPEAALALFELPERVLAERSVVVLGAEGRGLRPGVARGLDHRVRIPMGGRVASLNVASAAAVALFELRRRAAARGSH